MLLTFQRPTIYFLPQSLDRSVIIIIGLVLKKKLLGTKIDSFFKIMIAYDLILQNDNIKKNS